MALICSVVIGAVLGFLLAISEIYRCAYHALMRCYAGISSYVVTLALIAMFGMGTENIILAFILTRWAWFCRVIRTSVMQCTTAHHVQFAKTIGMSHFKIIHKHIMPLTLADIVYIK